MTIQLRPKDSTDDRFYSPDGDLAFNFANALRHTAYGLAEKYWEDWYIPYLRQNNVSEEDLGKMCVCMANFIQHTVNPLVKTPLEALTLAGVFALPAPVLFIFMAKLGQVITCMAWHRIREAQSPDVLPRGAETLAADAEVASRKIQLKFNSANACNSAVVENGNQN